MSGSRAAGWGHWEGRPASEWAREWSVPWLEVHDRIPSTNDRARALAAEGAELFTTVIAEEQTAGRGRGGRPWSAPPGTALLLSTVGGGASRSGVLLTPLLAGLAVVQAIEDELPELRPSIKWPNDVMVRGRKVSGILCETVGRRDAVIVGIGINVAQADDDFPSDVLGRAVSLSSACRRAISRSAVAGALMGRLRESIAEIPDRLGPRLDELAARDALAGKPVRVSSGLEGTARGIADDGSLTVVDARGAAHRVVAGSVRASERLAGGS